MARREIVQLVDDIDGTTIERGAGETVSFALDGVDYAIDLNDKNAKKLRDELLVWVPNARRTGGRRARSATTTSPATQRDYDAKSVRKWAESNKIDVPARGRIPAAVIEQYKAAGN